MKPIDHKSWGNMPKNMKDSCLTEIELIHYWREHNSELLYARSMQDRGSEDTRKLGKRIEDKLLFNMQSIVTNINKFRGARGE